jgi:hypothetical protein
MNPEENRFDLAEPVVPLYVQRVSEAPCIHGKNVVGHLKAYR